MGNSFSSTITPEKFKDQIFSIVLYYTSPKANTDLRFALKERCTPDNLPMPEDPDYRKMLDFYQVSDRQVLEYINKNILNSDENLARFYQTLISQLRGLDVTPTQAPTDHRSETDRLTRSRLDKIGAKEPSLMRPKRQYFQQKASSKTANKNPNFTKSQIVRPDDKMTLAGGSVVNQSQINRTRDALINDLMENNMIYTAPMTEKYPSQLEIELEGLDDGLGDTYNDKSSKVRSRDSRKSSRQSSRGRYKRSRSVSFRNG